MYVCMLKITNPNKTRIICVHVFNIEHFKEIMSKSGYFIRCIISKIIPYFMQSPKLNKDHPITFLKITLKYFLPDMFDLQDKTGIFIY